ncbi:MAG: glycosyltransferase family 4 protein, partial [bacterium]|nr:glycosyltransferase family 4 protein [bacterium]
MTKKLKVGFGPVLEDEYNIGVRGSRIDPIVSEINKSSDKYSADIFFDFDEMAHFDLIVIVKEFHPGLYPQIEALRSQGKAFVFDIVDNPFCTDPRSESYHDRPEFLKLMDGVISSSPVQSDDVGPINPNVALIEHPIINFDYSSYPQKSTVDIIWQGYMVNVKAMYRLHSILETLQKECSTEIRMIYHSNAPSGTDSMIRYVKWKIRDWQRMLAQADIGIVIKPPEDEVQRRKPSNKVLSYMAAGLPVVCTPTEADKLILEHGKTGFFAYTDDEWYSALKTLAEQPALRKTMGIAGREYVQEYFSIFHMTRKYLALFDET